MNILINKIKTDPTKLVDFFLFLVLCFPYANMLVSFAHVEPFFGLGMISFLPAGIIVVVAQAIMNKRMNHMDAAQFILGIITMLIGVCAWMIIFVVTG